MIFNLSKKAFTIVLLLAIVVVGVTLFLGLYFGLPREDELTGGVVANGYPCAKIGTDILKEGGSAADAAIATLFCEGVACPQSMGIGGGFMLTMYIRETKQVVILNARETAPSAAHEEMYVNQTFVRGIRSAAVPGELKGYYELHQKYGKLEWSTLIQPTIKLCRDGVLVTRHMSNALNQSRDAIKNDTGLTEVFINPETNDVWREGDLVKRLKFAETLEIIAAEGSDSIYNNGNLSRLIIQDIEELGGIITNEDLLNYTVKWEQPIVSEMENNKKLFTIPLPGSGVLLSFIMNILKTFLGNDKLSPITYNRILESFKFAYAKRTDLGDPEFVPGIESILSDLMNPEYAADIRTLIQDTVTHNNISYYGANYTITEDHGTAHISVLAPNGDAISVTSTINTYFGSKVTSKSTGIILNDEMDDFATPGIDNAYGVPPSPANFIAPLKRPMSSMCPTIIVDENDDAQLIIGAAGGTQITTAVAYVIIRHLWFEENLEDSVSAKRVHHQLLPMNVIYENGFNTFIINALTSYGHNVSATNVIATVTALARENNGVSAVFDERRGGSASTL